MHSIDDTEQEQDYLKHLEKLCDKYQILIEKSLGFQISEHITVERRGEDQWCVSVGGGTVLSKNLDIMYEPRPSSRTDEFISETRFSLDNALQLAYKFENSNGENL